MTRTKPKHTIPVNGQQLLLLAGMLLVSFGLCIHTSAYIFPWQEHPLRVWMFDVGQGDAFFIEFPDGQQMLVDGGRNDRLLSKVGSLLAPWDRTLDAILITHPDADHMTGFVRLLERYQVNTIYETGARAQTQVDRALASHIQDEPANHTILRAGDVIEKAGVRLTIVWPEEDLEGEMVGDRNNNSLVFLIEYGDTRILMTGDAEQEAEAGFVEHIGDIDVLKVGHHGSLSSSSWDFLEKIDPEIALVSVGEDNSYGHPHPVVLERLNEVGAEIFRTDWQGDVLLTSFGGEPQVQHHPLLY